MKQQSERSIVCQIHGTVESESIEEQGNNQQFQCSICIKQNESHLQQLEGNQNKNRQFQKDIKLKLNVLNSLLVQINKIQIIIQEDLDKLSDYLQSSIQEIKATEEKLKKSQKNQSELNNDLEIEIQSIQSNLEVIQKKLSKQLASLNFEQHINSLIQKLEDEWDSSLQLSKEQKCVYPVYQLSRGNQAFCHTFSFNYDDTLIVAGGLDKIFIYQLNGPNLIPQNQWTEKRVTYVKFFPTQENVFVSVQGTLVSKVKIWKQTKDYNFLLLQEFNEEYGSYPSMDCTIDQLVIGGEINLMFFNFKNSTLTRSQESKYLASIITNISINSKNGKLVCSARSRQANYIFIFGFDGKEWNEIQRIEYQNNYSVIQLDFVSQLKMLEEHFILLFAHENKLVVYKNTNGNYEEDQIINLRKQKIQEIPQFPISSFQNGFVCQHDEFLIFFQFTKRNKLQLNYQTLRCSDAFGCTSQTQKYLLVHEQNLMETTIFKFETEQI